MSDITRPSLTNDEDEMLEMQRQFLAGKILKSPEMEVVSAPTRDQEGDRKKSAFAKKRDHSAAKPKVSFEFPQVQVVKDVIEKVGPSCSDSEAKTTFPEPHPPASAGRSIFAQKMMAKRAKREEDARQPTPRQADSQFSVSSLLGSNVLGKTEAEKIHSDNVQKLSSMTEEQLIEEQKKLLQSLDPKVVAFLQKRAATSKPLECRQTPPIKEEPAEDEIPVDVSELKNSKWVHMDVVEKEKLAWMSSVPPVSSIQGKPFPARFDFEGSLLPYDAQFPTSSALYHHGEEAERAGYTVNELLILSRSSVLQQRVLALNTLAKILEKNQLGIYDECFSDPLIPNLLSNGLLLILRHSLDENNVAVAGAALVTISHLLSSNFDEICLDRCYLWYRGEEQPRLPSQKSIDLADHDEAELKDDQIAEIDVMKACLRIDLLTRIRYIIEILRPEPRSVLAALSILTRMGRHSVEAARAIVDCPRLIQSIVTFFLPADWTSLIGSRADAPSTLYGVPVRQVLRLLRVLSSWNADLARQLVSKYGLMDAIITYVAMDTSELNLPGQEGLLLILESYHTWRVFLQYGIGVEHFTDFYPALMKQLLFYQNSVSVGDPCETQKARFSHQLGAAMLLMLESVLRLCCSGHSRNLHFVHISGLRKPIEMSFRKWTCQLQQSDHVSESMSNLLAAAIQFLATYYTHWNASCGQEASVALDEICSGFIVSLIGSESMAVLSTLAVGHSNLISGSKAANRDPDSLPAVNATSSSGQPVPVLLPSSPFPLLAAIFRILRLWKTKCSPTNFQKAEEFLNRQIAYLERLGRSECALVANWFTRYEVHAIYEMLMFSCHCNLTVSSKSVLHRAALITLGAISSGGEFMAAHILKKVIFHSHFIESSTSALESAVERMSLSRPTYQHLLEKLVKNLNLLSSFYIGQLFNCDKLKESETRIELAGFINGQVGLAFDGRNLLPSDWIYLPLIVLYQKYLESGSSTTCSPVHLELVIRPLEAAYILLSSNPDWFFRICPAEHFCRLACLFLAANDLFLNSDVSGYLWPVLRGLCSSGRPLDFSGPIRGVDNFLDFYSQLLDQYEAVSYGNALFGLFLLLPLQQSQDVRYRIKFWCEHPTAIRITTVTQEQLPRPISHWLQPVEVNPVLLSKYAAAIRSGSITPERNPVLWQIANAHMNPTAIETEMA